MLSFMWGSSNFRHQSSENRHRLDFERKTATFFWAKRDQGQKVQLRIGNSIDSNSTNEIWAITIDWVRQNLSLPILPEEWRQATHGFLHEGLRVIYDGPFSFFEKRWHLSSPPISDRIQVFNDQNVAFKP